MSSQKYIQCKEVSIYCGVCLNIFDIAIPSLAIMVTVVYASINKNHKITQGEKLRWRGEKYLTIKLIELNSILHDQLSLVITMMY